MKFIIREGFKKLRYYKKLTFTTFLASSISYLVLGIFLIISSSLVASFNSFQENEIQVIAFVKPAASEEETSRLNTEIKQLQGVRKVEFISNNEGLENLKENFKDDEVINNIAEDNPLPHTFIIRLKTTKDADRVYNVLKNKTLVENINYEKEYLSEINKTMKNIKLALTAIVSGMILSSVFLVVIVISLSIHNQKQNIKVMSLTGAPTKYIRGPFVVQGLLISITSSVVSSFLTIYIFNELIDVIQKIFPFININTMNNFHTYIPTILITLGIILGGIGSSIASRIEIRKMFR